MKLLYLESVLPEKSN